MEKDFPIGVAWLVAVAQGRPMTVEDIADIAGRPLDQTSEWLDNMGVQPDKTGTLTDSEPPDVAMPRYQVHWLDTGDDNDVPGCSGDAILGVIAAQRPALIRLPCPVTAQLVELRLGHNGRLEDVRPPGAVAVMPGPDSAWHPRDWSRSQCANGLLFASAEDVSDWLAAHPGDITVPMKPFVRYQTQLLTAMGFLTE